MKSRIILSTANFSQNNIGRYVELDPFTKKVLSKQTQYAEDSNEAVALDTFLTSLTDGGFIGGENPKIKNLYIPALASVHDELFYDIAQLDANGYPTDGMSSAEKSATHKAFATSISGDKIVGAISSPSLDNPTLLTGDEFVAQSKIKQNVFNGLSSYPSFSFVYYNLKAYSDYSVRYQMLSNKPDTNKTDGQVGFELATNRIRIGKDGNNYCNLSNDSTYSTGYIGLSYQPSSTRMKLLADTGDIVNAFATYGDYSGIITTSDMQNTINFGAFTYSTNTQASLIILSDYLSEEELATLRTLVQTLMVGLGVRN